MTKHAFFQLVFAKRIKTAFHQAYLTKFDKACSLSACFCKTALHQAYLTKHVLLQLVFAKRYQQAYLTKITLAFVPPFSGIHIYIYTYIYTYIYIHMHICIYTHIYKYTYMHIYIYIYIYIHIHIYIYTYVHKYINTYLHIHIYTYIHIYIYTYIHIYVNKAAASSRRAFTTRPTVGGLLLVFKFSVAWLYLSCR